MLPAGFALLETLGRGGMGVVYLAFERDLARYVALKQLSSTWQGVPRARERFIREARAAARLSHPGIVPILNVGAEDDPMWYTMEYVEGGDLAQALNARGGNFPWREAVELVATVADAIHAAHEAGVVHRDIKPSNILLDANGSPKVADFGLAWMTGQELRELTATGELLGTPAYLAPECLAGRARADDTRGADIYALGAVLFHLVAGRPPFLCDHPLQTIGAIAHDTPPLLNQVSAAAAVPWELVDLCDRCLRKRPDDRLRSAGELAAALRMVLERQGSSRGVITRLKRVRHAVLWISVAGLLAFGAGLLFVHRQFAGTGDLVEVHGKGSLLVILPLRGIGSSPAVEMLAGGLHEEIISALNQVTDLRVISSSSSRAVRSDAEDVNTLRSALNADTALTGTVQQWQDTVRVSVQLISTHDATVLWAANYDHRETNLLNLQTDIAMDVAAKLHTRFSPNVRDALAGTGSGVPEAQDALLRAQALMDDASASVEHLDQAEALLTKAVDLDPRFAVALARLSNLHTLKYHWGNDRSERRLTLGLRAAQAALRENPHLVEAKLALAQYYLRGTKDFSTARRHVQAALEQSPSYAEALVCQAQIERRSGDFAASASSFVRALELDPLNPILAYNASDTLLRLRRYDDCSAILEAALKRMPGHVALVKLKGDLHLLWRGDLLPMEQDLATRNPSLPTPEFYLRDKVTWLTLARRFDEALALVRASPFTEIEGQAIYLTREGYEASILCLAGRLDAGRALLPAAWRKVSRELERRPNDPRVLLHAAEIKAMDGRRDEAVAFASRTISAGDPAEVDVFDRGFYLRSIAVILALVGDDAGARDRLRLLLRESNQTSKNYIRLHPILERYSAEFNQ